MAKKQEKSKAIGFTFRPFLATLSIFHKWQKQHKSNAIYIAFTFFPFFATYLIFHQWQKTAKR
jgi:hypothetical protein